MNAQAWADISAALDRALAERELAGANILIVHEGTEVWYHQGGYADVHAQLPIQRDSIFRLYSMTKPVIAAAVMLLIERKLLHINDPASEYLRGFGRGGVIGENGELIARKREVTVGHLLNMTSGLGYANASPAGVQVAGLFDTIDRRLLGDTALTTVEVANNLGEQDLSFQPGDSWEYGTSADILGAIVEVVSGTSLGNFLADEIFQPLGMNDTGFYVPPEKQSRLARAYETTSQNTLKLYEGNFLGIVHAMDKPPAFESGGAGLAGTIDDYAKFATMLLNEGMYKNAQVLEAQTIRQLTHAALTPKQQTKFQAGHSLPGFSYGNLMRIKAQPHHAQGLAHPREYGWDGWLGCYFSNWPDERLSLLVMMQKRDAGLIPFTKRVRSILLNSLMQ